MRRRAGAAASGDDHLEDGTTENTHGITYEERGTSMPGPDAPDSLIGLAMGPVRRMDADEADGAGGESAVEAYRLRSTPGSPSATPGSRRVDASCQVRIPPLTHFSLAR